MRRACVIASLLLPLACTDGSGADAAARQAKPSPAPETEAPKPEPEPGPEASPKAEAPKPEAPKRSCSISPYLRATAELLRPTLCHERKHCEPTCTAERQASELEACNPDGFVVLSCHPGSLRASTRWIGYLSGDQGWVLDTELAKHWSHQSGVDWVDALPLDPADQRAHEGALYFIDGFVEEDGSSEYYHTVAYTAEVHCALVDGAPRCSDTLVERYEFAEEFEGKYISTNYEASLELDEAREWLTVKATKLRQPKGDPARNGEMGLSFLKSKRYRHAKLLTRKLRPVELAAPADP